MAPARILIIQRVEASSHRYLRATIPWTRAKLLHVFNVYSYAVSYEEREALGGADYVQV